METAAQKKTKNSSGRKEDLRRPTLADLFFSFLRLGATAFGGPAMVAHIRDLSVNRKGWLDEPTFKDGVVLAQSIPGATAMQTAAYAGLRARGMPGALVSYAGFGLPAFFLMLLFSVLYTMSRNLHWATAIFSGLQVIVVAIIANATYTFGRASLKHYLHVILAAASALAFWLHASPFYVILGAALAGMLVLRKKPEGRIVKGSGHASFLPVFLLLAFAGLGLLGLYLFRPVLFGLSLLMLKVDLFAFGGGFASLPLMLQQVVHVKGWMDEKTFMDGIALGQVTPGPIVITAAFVGYVSQGLAGAFVGTVSIFTPSFLLVLITAPFFDRLKSSPAFVRATGGILASFVGLLLYVTVSFATATPWNLFKIIIALAALAALVRKIDLLYVVPAGAVLSLLLF
jgi:chromate transporter